jgi:mono/diheme cytochrome c family protein
LKGHTVKKTLAIVAVVLLVLAVVAIVGFQCYREKLTVDVPEYQQLTKVKWADGQNWTQAESDRFHHIDQGTQTFGIPYEWFMALEQPGNLFCPPGLLSDQTYLDRFGFIPDESAANDTKLPIGFAHGGPIVDPAGGPVLNPQTQAPMTSLGLTCAACHTGRLDYEGTRILIDGGSALTDVNKLQNAVAISVLTTVYIPSRFDRFAARVLGPNASDDAKSKLRASLKQTRTQMLSVGSLEGSVKAHSIEEGFTRLDALSRIGNTVFALDMAHPENFVSYSAPVHFPRIWYASWFLWVQYDGSIERPMVRNAGEALGVRATVEFPIAKSELPSSSVRVDELDKIEQQLAGKSPTQDNPFPGLGSPKWPTDIFPALNTDRVAAGAALYKQRCAHCHLAATTDPNFWNAPQWTKPNAAGQRYLNLNMVDISYVGTDPAQAEDIANRMVNFPETIGITDSSGKVIARGPFGPVLGQFVSKVVERWYNTQTPPTPDAERDRMNGYRDNGIQAKPQYKARPLNGIWATPPYLHNSSVPNLYSLLSPVSERPETFYLGNREYDPVNVGYHTEKLDGGFKFDTSTRGNSNAGHEFNNGSGQGIIGPLLTPDERYALIEYLKSL